MLSNQQVTFVANFLHQQNIEYQPFQEEMLDHICTSIEQNMLTGMQFHQASQAAFDAFEEDEIKELQSQILKNVNQKQLIMKKVSMIVLALMLLTTTFIYGLFNEPPSMAPIQGKAKISSNFGERMHPILKVKKMHKGMDFRAPIGTDVQVTSDGVVEKVEKKETGYGWHIVIRHDESYQTLYAQLSKIDVEVGQKVKKGDTIGAVGNSGASTGPHLHYEVIKDGEHQDPANYLKP